jgi:hypothetical protein
VALEPAAGGVLTPKRGFHQDLMGVPGVANRNLSNLAAASKFSTQPPVAMVSSARST